LLARLLFDALLTDVQRRHWLPLFLDDDRFHLCFAGDEGGIDYGFAYHRPAELDRAPTVVMERSPDGDCVLNGITAPAANAPLAKLFIAEAREAGAHASTLVLVPREAEGLSVEEPPLDTRTFERWSHAYSAGVRFERCRVPAAHVIRADKDGVSVMREAFLRVGEPQEAALNLGVGRAAHEAAIAYTQIRRQGGRLIVEHQGIGALLADAGLKLEVARNTVWKAAWAADTVADDSWHASALPTIARIFTAEAMREATEHAAECFGAMGVMRDMPMQKYVHDSLVSLHSGRNAGARLRIAEAITGYERGRAGSSRQDA
jgi:alkylation response protein AidB-like acyl-CoA dehydrogenase